MSVTEQKTASRTQLLCCFHTERMTSAKQKANVAAGEATAGVAIEDLTSQPNCGFAHKLSIRPHKLTMEVENARFAIRLQRFSCLTHIAKEVAIINSVKPPLSTPHANSPPQPGTMLIGLSNVCGPISSAKNVLIMPSSRFWTSRACFEPSRRRRRSTGQHVKELVLTPGKRDGEEVYEVSGEWELLPEKKCVILLVARDGIEPPTPAFSGLRSTS